MDIIFFIIILIFSGAAHELGHATVFLLYKKEVTIILGAWDSSLKLIQFNRVKLGVNFRNPIFFCCNSDDNFSTKTEEILCYLAGPLVNILIATLSYISLRYVHSDLIDMLFKVNVNLGVVNILPLKLPDYVGKFNYWELDGYLIYKLLKNSTN